MNKKRIKIIDIRTPQKHTSSSMFFLGYRKYLSVVAALLIISLGILASTTGATVSYFSDSETSFANTLHAGKLLFSVVPESYDLHVGNGIGSSTLILPEMIPGPQSFSIQYKVTASTTGGVPAFCSALLASATTSPFIYSGPLASLLTGTTTALGQWPVQISLPASTTGIVQGDICNLDLVYDGWNDGSQPGSGYYDQQKVSLTLHADIAAPVEVDATSTATTTDPAITNGDDDVPAGDPPPKLGNSLITSAIINGDDDGPAPDPAKDTGTSTATSTGPGGSISNGDDDSRPADPIASSTPLVTDTTSSTTPDQTPPPEAPPTDQASPADQPPPATDQAVIPPPAPDPEPTVDQAPPPAPPAQQNEPAPAASDPAPAPSE